MKKSNTYLSAFAFVVAFTIILSQFACDKSEEPLDERQVLINKLVGKTWAIHSVAGPNGDKTLDYENMKLSFVQVAGVFKVNYSVNNSHVIWSGPGVLEFSETVGNFRRSDSVVGALELPSDTELIIKVEWLKTTVGKGRVSSVEGDHSFTFVAQ
jgi:hypothetical protein